MAVTMRQVAAHAGVSPVVVSRVLHNKATSIRVSESTAERVRQSAEELGYRCNVWARNFRSQKTMQLGIIHGYGFSRPKFSVGSKYFATLMDGVIEGAFEHGYTVAFCPSLLSETAGDVMSDGRFDGFIWYSSLQSEEHAAILQSTTVPIVVLHATGDSIGHKWPTVLCDNRQGISLALDHLIGLGHKKIAYFTEFGWGREESVLRLQAFRSLMQERNLPVDDSDIIDISVSPNGLDELLSRELRHTALLCHNDALAQDAYEAAGRHRIDIPGQLSVVGFDSTSFCNEFRPRLTSIRQPLHEVGRVAAHEVVRLIQSADTVAATTAIPCDFDIRESTAPPNKRVSG